MEHTDHVQEPRTDTGAPPPLSDAIARLMAQPELLSMVASAIGAPSPVFAPEANADTEAADTAEEARVEETADAAAAGAEADGDTGKEAAVSKDTVSAALPELIAALAPLLGGKGLALGGAGGGKDDDRTRLLRALKPYLSPGRREAIDTVIRLSRITDTLKRLS